MKKICQYLVQHIRQDFHAGQYSVVGIFLFLTIFVNYQFDIEDNFLEAQTGFRKFLYYYVFYSLAYFFTLLTYSVIRKESAYWKNRSFWIKSTLAIAVLSLDNSVSFLRPWVNYSVAPQVQYWAYKVSVNLISFFTIFLPLLGFYFLKEKKETHRYGLNGKRFDVKPYFAMLLIMLPLIAAASFHPSFLKQYPMYKTSAAHQYLMVPAWVTVIGYELAYGLDFVTVEFLFRGFMVIGMISVLGRSAVLAMAVTYCFLHFGKPPGEAISSIAGGYILGIIAYETKSLWGGIVVHVGIAWMMEAMAFFVK